MMRLILPPLFVLTPLLFLAPVHATADPGHLADVAGHGHWVAGAAIGIGIWGALKGREEAQTDKGADPQGARDQQEQAA